jgi:hypothetical protein
MQDTKVRSDRSWQGTFIDIVNRKTQITVKDSPTVGDNTHVLNLLVLVITFDSSAFSFENDLLSCKSKKYSVYGLHLLIFTPSFLDSRYSRKGLLSWAIQPVQR